MRFSTKTEIYKSTISGKHRFSACDISQDFFQNKTKTMNSGNTVNPVQLLFILYTLLAASQARHGSGHLSLYIQDHWRTSPPPPLKGPEGGQGGFIPLWSSDLQCSDYHKTREFVGFSWGRLFVLFFDFEASKGICYKSLPRPKSMCVDLKLCSPKVCVQIM
jgi:hypothetical protein